MLFLFYPLRFLAYLSAFLMFFCAQECGEICGIIRQICAIFPELCVELRWAVRYFSRNMRESAAYCAEKCGELCEIVRWEFCASIRQPKPSGFPIDHADG